jgi:hypothetical protein
VLEVVLRETLLVNHAARLNQAKLILSKLLLFELIASLLFRGKIVLQVLAVYEVLAVKGLPLCLKIPLVVPVKGVVEQLV